MKLIIKELQQKNNELKECLKKIINCPHSLAKVTIPKAGIEKNPEQVVYNYSIGYIRIKEAKSILECK